MSTKISLTYFGMPGTGATVKEAKADAGKKLEAYIEAGPRVHLVSHPQLTDSILVWNTPQDGWQHHFPRPSAKCCEHLWGTSSLGHVTEKHALTAARNHLASLTRDAAIARQLIVEESDWQNWRSRRAFQLAYEATTGTDSERHQWACHHSAEFIDQVAA